MNVGIKTVAAHLLSWEHLFRIFGIVSLQPHTSRMGLRQLVELI
jgi:hypothetical protein